MQAFFVELRRRNVLKVGAAYVALGWLAVELLSLLLDLWEAPAGMLNAFAVIIAAGFPVALVIAWSFEMTPNGMKRTHNVAPDEHIPYWSRRKYMAFIVGAASLGLVIYAFQQWRH